MCGACARLKTLHTPSHATSETAELALHCLLSKEILSGPALLAAWAQSGRSLAACCAEGASCDAAGRAEALAWYDALLTLMAISQCHARVPSNFT